MTILYAKHYLVKDYTKHIIVVIKEKPGRVVSDTRIGKENIGRAFDSSIWKHSSTDRAVRYDIIKGSRRGASSLRFLFNTVLEKI